MYLIALLSNSTIACSVFALKFLLSYRGEGSRSNIESFNGGKEQLLSVHLVTFWLSTFIAFFVKHMIAT